jgi:hypothetical protein
MSDWYVEKFNKLVPLEAQAAVAFSLLAGYAEAAKYCRRRFPRFGWQRALGAVRWFHIEEALLGLADECPTLRPVLLPNCVRSHHFGLAQTDDVYFTIAKVATPTAKPPSALFRHDLQSPVQMSWLDEWESLPPAGLCALLIHGPDEDDPSRPAFARIKFMDGADAYLPEHIDLYRDFIAAPSLVERVEIERRQLVQPRRVPQERSN